MLHAIFLPIVFVRNCEQPRPIHEVKYDSLHRASFDNTALMHLRPPSGVQAEVVQHLQRLLCGSLSEGRVEEGECLVSLPHSFESGVFVFPGVHAVCAKWIRPLSFPPC